jgi:hypothetical protein
MKNIFLKLVAVVTLLSSSVVFAIPSNEIEGKIEFFGLANISESGGKITAIDFISAMYNDINDPGNYISAEVVTNDVSGDFSSIVGGTVATFEDPWNVGPVASLWTVAGFTFTVTDITANSSNILGFFQGVKANGFITGNGFDQTASQFTWTSQIAGTSFSATTVPTPATIALLGLALVGFGATRRKKTSLI